ncbi:MAG: DDE-type integrase/transposase/recombinase, partial [Planctomycetes bacterium]|nr:DDE-type integrase/transposase/recombinase [Planctomycetota bacterium]
MKGPSGRRRRPRYAPDFRLKVVRTALEKDMTADEVVRLYHIGKSTWQKWKAEYQEGGEEALLKENSADEGAEDKAKTPTTPPEWRNHVVATKRQFPFFGAQRVWHWLRRTLYLPITPREVKETLREEGLVTPVPPKRRQRRAPVPKRFERAQPNQMWQSDITMFTIGKTERVYLIGFMDDHSRYLVGWGLYTSQSGDLVLEVLRNAFATYGKPLEM